jgi:hypothetical protein
MRIKDKDQVAYMLRAMRDGDFPPKINKRTGEDRNDLKRWALDYAIEALEKSARTDDGKE